MYLVENKQGKAKKPIKFSTNYVVRLKIKIMKSTIKNHFEQSKIYGILRLLIKVKYVVASNLLTVGKSGFHGSVTIYYMMSLSMRLLFHLQQFK